MEDTNKKELNLDISIKISEYLTAFGFEPILTRRTDILLYDENVSSTRKHQDLCNRTDIANNSNAECFISIHMNKYSAEYCKGMQIFYSDRTENGYVLANLIQENTANLNTEKQRKIKNGTDSMYILENANIPSVLIECGFISNKDESKLLSQEEYRQILAFSIYCGISAYLEL